MGEGTSYPTTTSEHCCGSVRRPRRPAPPRCSPRGTGGPPTTTPPSAWPPRRAAGMITGAAFRRVLNGLAQGDPAGRPAPPAAGGRARHGPPVGRRRAALRGPAGAAQSRRVAAACARRPRSPRRTGRRPGGPSCPSYDGKDTGPASSAGRATAAPAPVSAAGPAGQPVGTRPRNEAAGLCPDVPDGPRAGAGARPAPCSSRWTQRWTHEDDGLLRPVAGAGLCLDSRADAGVVVLGTCADEGGARGGDVRCARTGRDELVPRRDPQLALAPLGADPGADLVVVLRDSSTVQRRRTDPPDAGTPGPREPAPTTRRPGRSGRPDADRYADQSRCSTRSAGPGVAGPACPDRARVRSSSASRQRMTCSTPACPSRPSP